MVIIMKPGASQESISQICSVVESKGLGTHIVKGAETTIIGLIGDKTKIVDYPFEVMEDVEKVTHISESYKLVNKAFHPEPTVIKFDNGVEIGGKKIVVMAGPCAVENQEMITAAANYVKSAGASFLRGGAYKPRTSPYSFQGLEVDGLKLMYNAKKEAGMLMVTEVINERSLEAAYDYLDIIQIGARNMQNFALLREVGRLRKPVLLKRGLSSTIDEWLNAAEYIMAEGNEEVMLCERGIRTYETATRNTLDLSAVPVLKSKTHLPIIVDPSHGTGKNIYVPSMAKAAVAAGADGLIIEVHPTPKKAVSDGDQSLNFDEFGQLMEKLKIVANAVDREI